MIMQKKMTHVSPSTDTLLSKSLSYGRARAHAHAHSLKFWLDNIKETAYLVALRTARRIILTINRGKEYSENRDHLHKI
jgi:hypothetical protein